MRGPGRVLVRTLIRALGVLVLTAAAVLGASFSQEGRVWAHTELASSDPSAGAVLEVVPQAATLTFTQDIDPNFAEVALSVDGQPASAAVAGIAGPVLSYTVADPGPEASTGTSPRTFAVAYRVVSADGHPITGEVTYQVALPPAAPSTTPGASPESSPDASSAPAGDAGAEPAGAAEATEATEATEAGVPGWALGVGAAAVAGGAAVVALRRSRRPGTADQLR